MPKFKEYLKWKYFRQPWRLVAIIQWKLLTFFGLGVHYAEQVVWRMNRCPECVANKSCKHCPCNVFGMMISPWGRCSDYRWGKMMNRKQWELYKNFNQVQLYALDPGLADEEGNLAMVEQLREQINNYTKKKNDVINDIEELKVLFDHVRNDYNELVNLYMEKKEIYLNFVESKNKYEDASNNKISTFIQEMLKGTRQTEIEIDDTDEKEFQNKELNEDEMRTINSENGIDWIKERLKQQLYVPEVLNIGEIKRGTSKKFEIKYTGDLEVLKASGSCTCVSTGIKDNIVYGEITKSKEVTPGPGESSMTLYLKKPEGNYYIKTALGDILPEHRDFYVKVKLQYTII